MASHMGLSLVYAPQEGTTSPVIDIVAVHGLGGDAINTWTHPKSEKFWLKDFLPQQIPDARIMTFGYDASAAFGQSTAEVVDYARSLLSSLVDKRETPEEYQRPLIFISHSLGGIVVKQALLQAQLEKRYQKIKIATLGLIFLGTPHRGSDKATYGEVLAKVAQFISHRPPPRLLNTLQTNSKELLRLANEFRFQLPDYQVYSFYEQRPMKSLSSLIVERHSALIETNHEEQIPVDADHSALCKFETEGDDTFEKVYKRLKRMRNDAQRIANEQSASYNKHFEVPRLLSPDVTGREKILEHVTESSTPDLSSYTPLKYSSPHFTGRRDFIARLSNFFEAGRRSRHCRRDFVLYGLGGCGKTQICLKFAEENSDRFWRIYWMDATNTTTLDLSFSEIAQDPAAQKDSVEATKASIFQWLSRRDREWLLIFDNADGEPETIEKYLPPGTRGNTLITTRNPNVRLIVQEGAFAHVDQMNEMEAISLLSSVSLINDKSEENLERLKSIVQELGFIPLAIHHAATAIATGYCNARDYLEFFHHNPLQLLNYRHHKGASQYGLSLSSAWQTSRAAIQRHEWHEVALHIFRIFAFFHPNGIMEDIFRRAASFDAATQDGRDSDPVFMLPQARDHLPRRFLQSHEQRWDAIIFKEGIRLLFKHSFIQIDASNRAYSVHPLVQQWERYRMTESERVRTYYEATALLAAAAGSQRDKEARVFRRQLVTHVHSLHRLQAEVGIPDHYYDDACEYFWALYAENERWKDAEKVGLKMLKERRRALGTISPATVDATEYLAKTLNNLGCCEKAERLQKKALIYKRVFLGPGHEETLDSTSALAMIYFQQARYKDAESLQIQVFEAQANDPGCNDRRKLKTAAALSRIFHGQTKYDEAAVVLSPFVTYMENILDIEPLTALEAMENLAAVFHELYQLEDAEGLKVKIFKERKRLQGGRHPATLMAMANLAATFVRQDRLNQAMELVEPLIAMRKEVLGESHRDTLTAMLVLTNIYVKQRKWKEAEQVCKQVIQGRESELPFNHPHTIWSKAHLALIYHHQGKLDESSEIWAEVISAQEKVRGTEHMETLLSNHNLALVRKSQGQHSLARDLMERTFRLREKTLGPIHFRTIESCQVLRRWEQPQPNEPIMEAPSPLAGRPTRTLSGSTPYQNPSRVDSFEASHRKASDVGTIENHQARRIWIAPFRQRKKS